LGEGLRSEFLQVLAEESAKVGGQRLFREEKLGTARDPLALVWAQATAGDQVVDVRMENESPGPSVENGEHAELGAQAFGVGGQVLEGLRAGVKEDLVTELRVRTDPRTQWIGHGEGDQEIRDRQQQTLTLLL
jgi:hypothetical protein